MAGCLKFIMMQIIILMLHAQQRYFMDDDNDLGAYTDRWLAFPINICFQSTIIGTAEYTKYSCTNSDTKVAKEKFTTSSCSFANRTFFEKYDINDTSPCGTPRFSCDGQDQYQEITFYPFNDQCTTSLATMPLALGCFCDSVYSSYSAECGSYDDSFGATLTEYSDSTNCSSIPDETLDLTQCSIAISAQEPTTIDVYQKISRCRLYDTEAPSLDFVTILL